jgi:hypothetical protein
MEIGTSQAEPIWAEFLRKLTRRGLRSENLAVSDAQVGIKAAFDVGPGFGPPGWGIFQGAYDCQIRFR